MDLYDYETNELIGPATAEQIAAADSDKGGTGGLVIDAETGAVVPAKDAEQYVIVLGGSIRCVYVA